jgi:hypothetical protein
MTRERTKLLLPVLQAWAYGKTIQVRVLPNGQWGEHESDPADFSNENWEWRVKPTPRRWWAVLHSAYADLYSSEVVAVANSGQGPKEIIEVVEVLK